MVRPGATSRARARWSALRTAALAALGLSLTIGIGLVPLTAAAASDVVVDDFGGTTLGVRTQTLTGSGAGAAPRASFQQSIDGETLTTTGGDAPAGIELDYAFGPTDL